MNKERINYFWPRIGGILASIITVIVFLNWESSNSQIAVIYLLHLAVLMFHEFEEYVFPGGFKEFFNSQTIFALAKPQKNAPVNEAVILVINLGFWVIFAIAALIADIAPWLGVAMVIMNFSNIFGHLMLFQIKKKGYNPGLVTAALLMIPFSVYVFRYVGENQIMNDLDWILAIVFGIISATTLPVIGTVMKKRALSEGELI